LKKVPPLLAKVDFSNAAAAQGLARLQTHSNGMPIAVVNPS
jgi:hypothetical protein